MSEINNTRIRQRSDEILHLLYGENSEFRDGQYEAIEATLTQKRTLVVQRTGWGKSLVYFICTKLMREQHRGVTMVISPLLVLMSNQIEAAEKLGLKCDALNSSVKDRREDIIRSLENDELDMIFVTPETLFSVDVQEHLKNIKIGLFVIDEAHCISDWGHDFRLEYGRLNDIIKGLPDNVPILCTTATANDRVVNDINNQLGGEVYISRGPLSRKSLSIQVLKLQSRIERYAWLLENLPKLPGSGIIYCLTQRDCDYLSDFLNKNGISAAAYYSRSGGEEAENLNTEAIEKFSRNEIKAIVATIKLGMGYDKGDIAFVIHYQTPENIVSYYQQIGRAGRNIDDAYTFLMCGEEDKDIIDFFIKTAFPKKEETDALMDIISKNDGITLNQLDATLNIRRSRMKKSLMFLLHDGFIIKDGTKYYAAAKKYIYNKAHYDEITAIRIREAEQIREFIDTDKCYSKFVVNCLDDRTAAECGRCANCLRHDILPSKISSESAKKAADYIDGQRFTIIPRKMWAESDVTKYSKIKFPNQTGICLSRYGEAGYGELVKSGKYVTKRFSDELVGKSSAMLSEFVRENNIGCICPVPSLRSNIVGDFAKRLAEMLKIEYAELLVKKDAPPQKSMENGSHQCQNAFNSFFAVESESFPKNVLLVDDIVDSKWTFTVCGYRLMEAGCENVYPYALADSSNLNEE